MDFLGAMGSRISIKKPQAKHKAHESPNYRIEEVEDKDTIPTITVKNDVAEG